MDFTDPEWWTAHPVGTVLLFKDESRDSDEDSDVDGPHYTIVVVEPPHLDQYSNVVHSYRVIMLSESHDTGKLFYYEYTGHIGLSRGTGGETPPIAIEGQSQRSLTDLKFLLFAGTTPFECVRGRINRKIKNFSGFVELFEPV